MFLQDNMQRSTHEANINKSMSCTARNASACRNLACVLGLTAKALVAANAGALQCKQLLSCRTGNSMWLLLLMHMVAHVRCMVMNICSTASLHLQDMCDAVVIAWMLLLLLH
jgi:hypothetical protein